MNVQRSLPQPGSAAGISNAACDLDHIESLFRAMITRSYPTVCQSTMIERSYDNPLTEQEQNALRRAVEQEYASHGPETILHTVEKEIESFVDANIVNKFKSAGTYSTFFEHCLSLDLYLDHVAQWLNVSFAALNQDQGDSSVGIMLTNTFYREIHRPCRSEIIEHFVDRAEAIRNSHSYLADWAFQSLHSARFMKIIRIFQAYYPLNSDDDGKSIHSWNLAYIEVVRDHFWATIDSISDIREALAIARFGFNLEWDLYTKTFSQPSYLKETMKEILIGPISEYFMNRFLVIAPSFSIIDLIMADDRSFDGILLSDLFHLLCYNGLSFYNMITDLRVSLSQDFWQKCIRRVDELFSKNLDVHQWDLGRTMETYWDISLSYTSRWRNALQEVLEEDQLERIKRTFSEGISDRITKRRAVKNIDMLSKACADHLCGMNGPAPRGMNLEVIIHFYQTVANRKSLMDHAISQLFRNSLAGTGHSHQSLISFCQDPRVTDVPEKLVALLRSVEESQKASEAFNQENESCSGVLENGNPKVKVSGLILDGKYWPEYEGNLLRIPRKIFDINGRFADKSKAENNPRSEDNLNVQNAQTMVQIQTKVFAAKKKRITLKLTVYQLSVFRCLGKTNKMSVEDLCSQLIRPDLTESNDRVRARKVVKLVLLSLIAPYKFLKVFPNDSMRSTRELRPSIPEEISRSHYVVLNRGLQLRNEFLQLQKPDLTISNLDEISGDTDNEEEETSGPADRGQMGGGVAMQAVLANVRNKCRASESGYIHEEEAMTAICNGMRRFGLTPANIQRALEIHIRIGNIERTHQGGTNMLRCTASSDLD